MTKHVRIENADTSNYVVLVHVQDDINGKWITARTERLEYPTELLREMIHSGRRIIIEEGGARPV